MRLALGVLLVPAAPSLACDSSSCALILRGASTTETGFRFDISARHIDMGARLAGSRGTREVVRPLIDFERERIVPGYQTESGGEENFVQFDLSYGFTPRLSILASVPLIAEHSVTHTYLAPLPGSGRESSDGRSVPHTTSGFGDVLVGVRVGLVTRRDHRMTAGFSVGLPTGRSRAVSHVDGLTLDPMVQAGSGAFTFVPSLDYVHRGGPLGLDWTGSTSYQINATDGRDYRFGNEGIVAATASRRVVSGLSASLQIKHHRAARSRHAGEDVASTGAAFWHLTPGLRFQTKDGGSFYGYLQIPVHRYVNETQLAPRLGLLVGFSLGL